MANTIWPSAAQAIANATKIAVAPLAWDPANHLLSRFTFGPTAAHRAWIAAHGPDAWISSQINAGTQQPGYGGNAAVAALGPLLTMNPYDTRQWMKDNLDDEYGWAAMQQLSKVTMGLQLWSSAQLYETVVDFFANHLNVSNYNGDLWNTRHCFDRDVIRKYAFDSFTNMLLASAKHPAMLQYLNLADSTKTAINENYGRELLELHTVGLNYSEDDVKNAARLLTGRTINEHHHYLFDSYIHPTGPIKVLGFTHDNAVATDGESAGNALIRYLAAHPFTATRLARKLCIRFVSDSPSDALVAAVAKAYLDNGTRIVPTIKTILRSTEFWESRGRKVRRPVENLYATVRIMNPQVKNLDDALDSLQWVSDWLGQRPLDWAPPNGYPDVATAWRSSGSLLRTWEMHLAVTGGWWDGFAAPSIPALYGSSTPATSGEAIDLLCRALTGNVFSTAHKAALQTFLKEPASTPMSKSILRWWLTPLVTLILDSPHHALR